MSRILIVSALRQELSDIDDVLYTGVGKVNATYKLTELLTRVYGKDRFDLVINYGTAASKIHSGLVDCTKFIQRDMDATALGFEHWETPFEDKPSMIDFSHIKNPINKNLCCFTGDSFMTDIKTLDVVDMEAYALAKVCRNFDIDFVSYKYISDDGNADDWEENCSKGAEEFKKVLEYYDTI